jgi:hypothetical protein
LGNLARKPPRRFGTIDKTARGVETMKNLSVNLLDIKFYLSDDEGNEVLNENGKVKEYRIKDNIRFKPLEYLCEDFDIDILEEIKH